MTTRLVFLTVVCVGSLAFGQDPKPPATPRPTPDTANAPKTPAPASYRITVPGTPPVEYDIILPSGTPSNNGRPALPSIAPTPPSPYSNQVGTPLFLAVPATFATPAPVVTPAPKTSAPKADAPKTIKYGTIMLPPGTPPGNYLIMVPHGTEITEVAPGAYAITVPPGMPTNVGTIAKPAPKTAANVPLPPLTIPPTPAPRYYLPPTAAPPTPAPLYLVPAPGTFGAPAPGTPAMPAPLTYNGYVAPPGTPVPVPPTPITPVPAKPAPEPTGFTMHFHMGGNFDASLEVNVTQGKAKQKANPVKTTKPKSQPATTY